MSWVILILCYESLVSVSAALFQH